MKMKSRQSRAAGDGFARYWLHNGWVTMGGEKMSKSLGNVLSIPAMLERGATGRTALLPGQRALPVDAGVLRCGAARRGERLCRGGGVSASRSQPAGAVVPGEWTPRFAAALDDDLSVPIALAEIHQTRAEGNRALDGGDHEGALRSAGAIRAMMGILGCDPLDERWESRDETSAALAAVDVLVQAELENSGQGARAAQLGARRRDPQPAQRRRCRGHRHRRRPAVVAGW